MSQYSDPSLQPEQPAEALRPGVSLLRGQFTIERFLGMGGFGITYLATDSLERKVVLKECFPGVLSTRDGIVVKPRTSRYGNDLSALVQMFLREARHLARLSHPNIVGVHQVFEENNTAYIALDLIRGRELLDFATDDERHNQPQFVARLLTRLLTTLDYMHGEGLLHRDIAPDNIIVDAHDNPVLIDFGAAILREKISEKARTSLLAVKDGYSPPESYLKGNGPIVESDIYSLGATFYHLIDGAAPTPSNVRMTAVAQGLPDPYEPLVGRHDGYHQKFLASIDRALNVDAKDRFPSALEWNKALPAQISVSASVLQILRKRRDATAVKAEG